MNEPTPESNEERVTALEKLMNQRMTANEHAVTVAHDDLVRVPTAVDKAVATLKDLIFAKMETIEEKFANISIQFALRDRSVEQSAKDTKVAVDAALQAAEKAVTAQNLNFTQTINKSEDATRKQIEALSEKITALTDRINLATGRQTGVTSGVGYVIVGVGAVATFLGAVATFLVLKEPSGNAATSYPVSAAPSPTPVPQIIYVPIPPPQGTQQSAPK